MSNNEILIEKEIQVKVDYVFSNSFNHTLHAYIDIAEDLIAGTLLSQIMYWFSFDKKGNRKVRIFKDGNYWIAKNREDWFNEIKISSKQYDNAIKKLKKKGLVETKLYKFNSAPTTHIRPIYENINAEITKWKKEIANTILNFDELDTGMFENSNLSKEKNEIYSLGDMQISLKNKENPNLPNEENGIYPNGKMEFTQWGKWNLPNGENGIYPMGKMEFTQTGNSITEITNRDYITEITNKDKDAFEIFWKIYPRKKDKSNASKKFYIRLNSGFSKEELIEAAKNYADECSKNCTEERYIKYATTFLGDDDDMPFVDYLDKNYISPKIKVIKNSFNNIPQQDYDFNELEKRLLKRDRT